MSVQAMALISFEAHDDVEREEREGEPRCVEEDKHNHWHRIVGTARW